ncbi:MAG: hypothetical protein JWN03_7641, partial [Nocardia sp.]|nr:hypothetical protein [Nocardia sp.]
MADHQRFESVHTDDAERESGPACPVTRPAAGPDVA